jgi:Zn-dependent protease
MAMTIIIFELAILLFSVIIHEISHGAVAYYLGDDTAYRMGRLTLNPIPHIDPIGSVILPLILSLPLLFGIQPVIIGWAKPVPYDPRFLKNPKTGAGLIALAGPASNILIAIIFIAGLGFAGAGPELTQAFQYIILINLMLAVFNMVPIPPLDGSKMLAALLPDGSGFIHFLERNATILIIAFIFFGLPLVQAIVAVIYGALTTLVGA